MKKFILLALITSIFSCEPDEVVERRQENLVMEAMTNGQWKVSSFIKGGTDITSDFNSYKFQFKTNYTVDAIQNGVLERTGTWTADPDAQTITSGFTNVSHPLTLLNGTFYIESTTWTSVDAKQTVNGELRILKLDKL